MLAHACRALIPRDRLDTSFAPSGGLIYFWEGRVIVISSYFLKNGYNGDMMRILRVEGSSLKAVVQDVAQALQQGRVIACPTDTVYGLIVDATSQEAVDKVFQIKQREKSKPIYVFVKDIEMAREYAQINKEQEEFLKKNWPGKVTAVLEGKHKLAEGIELGGKIGLRIPKHQFVQDILEKFGKPLTGTSANISGIPSCQDSKEVVAQFEGQELRPDIVIDAGKLPESNASQIIDITETPYRVLRK